MLQFIATLPSLNEQKLSNHRTKFWWRATSTIRNNKDSSKNIGIWSRKGCQDLILSHMTSMLGFINPFLFTFSLIRFDLFDWATDGLNCICWYLLHIYLLSCSCGLILTSLWSLTVLLRFYSRQLPILTFSSQLYEHLTLDSLSITKILLQRVAGLDTKLLSCSALCIMFRFYLQNLFRCCIYNTAQQVIRYMLADACDAALSQISSNLLLSTTHACACVQHAPQVVLAISQSTTNYFIHIPKLWIVSRLKPLLQGDSPRVCELWGKRKSIKIMCTELGSIQMWVLSRSENVHEGDS